MRIDLRILAFTWLVVAAQFACGQAEDPGIKTDPNRKYTVVPIREETDGKKIASAYPELKKQADVLRTAFMNEDFERYADFMHPVALEAVGGREGFVTDLRKGRSNLRSNGAEFESYTIGNPAQLIEIKNRIFIVLPYETKMRHSQRLTTEEGNILAVSESNGRDWKFIRATSKERLRFLYPDVVDRLKFSESRMR